MNDRLYRAVSPTGALSSTESPCVSLPAGALSCLEDLTCTKQIRRLRSMVGDKSQISVFEHLAVTFRAILCQGTKATYKVGLRPIVPTLSSIVAQQVDVRFPH